MTNQGLQRGSSAGTINSATSGTAASYLANNISAVFDVQALETSNPDGVAHFFISLHAKVQYSSIPHLRLNCASENAQWIPGFELM